MKPKRRLLLPLALGLVFVIFFDSPVVFPFRLFVVFLHEISHGLAAVLTGGRILSIAISPNEGGVCVTRGGWRSWSATRAYLGQPVCSGRAFLLLGDGAPGPGR